MEAIILRKPAARWHKFLLGAVAIYGVGINQRSGLAVDSSATSSATLSTHYTQGTFRIPFQVQPGGRCPQQLDLLVSRDSGRSWHIHQSAAPAEKYFEVTDADEGEFLLKVQARDGQSAAVSRSLMKLIVDRTAPQVDLTCDWQPESGLAIGCVVKDPSLDPKSIKIQMHVDNEADAVQLPVACQTQHGDSIQLTCQVSLPACDSFRVTVSTKDKAGNQMTLDERFAHPDAKVDLEVTAPAQQSVAKSMPDTLQPSLHIDSSDWSAVTFSPPVSATESQSTIRSTNPIENRPAMQLTGYKLPPRGDASRVARPVELTPPDLAPEPSQPSAALELTAPEASPQSSSSADISSSERSNIPRVDTQSRKLTLQYQFDQRQSHLTAAVELWCSVDQGRSWSYWGTDQDCQSPCRVEVEQVGEYHFRIVSLTGPQDEVLRPKAGEAADIIVNVLPERRAPIRLQPVR